MLLISSCNRKVFYSNDQRVDEKGWSLHEKAEFDVDVPDSTTFYNFLIDLRVTTDYPYSNAFLFITTTFPDSTMARDTLECPLADVTGRWLGKRSGQYVNNRYYLKPKTRFRMPGKYHFEITHGMRDAEIVGIKNVGLHIEYAE